MTRRLSETLLLALLVLAVQTALLTHEHGDSSAPAGLAAQGCELCVGYHAVAPPPDAAVAARPEPGPVILLPPGGAFAPPSRPADAHQSRAPPAFRST